MSLVMSYNDNMTHHKLNLVYHGEINQSITKTFSSLAEENLQKENEDRRTVRKVYHVMVEFMQNIYKHTDPNALGGPGKSSQGIVLVGADKKGYVVATGNPIMNAKCRTLSTILDSINELSNEDLQRVYKKKMQNGLLTKKGGAGLGFIDVSRKTGSKLDYKFESIDEKTSFFVLKTYIAK